MSSINPRYRVPNHLSNSQQQLTNHARGGTMGRQQTIHVQAHIRTRTMSDRISTGETTQPIHARGATTGGMKRPISTLLFGFKK